jgi:hypothetical protein
MTNKKDPDVGSSMRLSNNSIAKKPWRSEEINDIIGDNIYHDKLENKKDPDELRERIKDIVHKTYKHNDTTELLEDIAADELLALISTEQDKARIDELERTVNASDEKKWQQDYTRVFEISLYREWRLKELEGRVGK